MKNKTTVLTFLVNKTNQIKSEYPVLTKQTSMCLYYQFSKNRTTSWSLGYIGNSKVVLCSGANCTVLADDWQSCHFNLFFQTEGILHIYVKSTLLKLQYQHLKR